MGYLKCYDISGYDIDYIYQWDINRKVIIKGIDFDENMMIHICHVDSVEALNIEPTLSGNDIIVSIPNILLQRAAPVVLYFVRDSGNASSYTTQSLRITVVPRAKPSDYVYTETEVLTWKSLDERLNKVEKNMSGIDEEDIANAIEDYLIKHPGGNVDLDTTLTQSGKAADAKAVGDALAKIEGKIPTGDNGDKGGWASSVINLEKYGIVQADYTPPFTVEMYNIAYANHVGFQKAIDDAAAAGVASVVIPAGNYPLVYTSDNIPCIVAGNVDIEGYGAKLYVLYDDDGINPYAPETNPHQLCGTILQTNGSVAGLELVGERHLRTHENTKYREGSAGIEVGRHSSGRQIRDCYIHRFSGDGIGFQGGFDNIKVTEELPFSIGTVTDGSVVLGTGDNLISDEVRFAHLVHTNETVLYAPSGYTYLFPSRETPKLHFWDTDHVYIGMMRVPQNVPFRCPENAYYLRLELDPTPGTQFASSPFRIGNASAQNVTIDNCEIAYNQRGGISNQPTGTVIRRCRIHDNGRAYDGMPAFYDGTQFGVDIEDWPADNITIESCVMWGQNHDILWRNRKLTIRDCVLFSNVKSMRCIDLTLEGSKLYGGLTLTTMSYGVRKASGCQISGTVPKELHVIDSVPGVVRGALDKDDSSKANFYDEHGNKLFDLDLTYLNREIGDSLTSKGLIFGFDFEKIPEGQTVFRDETDSATIDIKDTAVKSVGLGASPTYGDRTPVKWDNEHELTGNDLSVEVAFIGYSGFVLYNGNFMHCPATGSGVGQSTDPTKWNARYDGYGNKEYNNSAGELKSVRYGVCNQVYDDNGNAVIPSPTEHTTADMQLNKLVHIVLNFNPDGTVTRYLNGKRCVTGTDPIADDFVEWNFDRYEKEFYLARNSTALRSARLYNRLLTAQDAYNNFVYELKRAETTHRVYYVLSNATTDSDPCVVATNLPYSANITAKDGYTLKAVTVTMGGVDITETAYADGVINIDSVTGDVIVTATTVAG